MCLSHPIPHTIPYLMIVEEAEVAEAILLTQDLLVEDIVVVEDVTVKKE